MQALKACVTMSGLFLNSTLFPALKTDPRALHMIGRYPTTELRLAPVVFFSNFALFGPEGFFPMSLTLHTGQEGELWERLRLSTERHGSHPPVVVYY